MHLRTYLIVTLLATFVATAPLQAATPTEATKDAIRKAIPLLEKGSAGSAEQRTCFTCHSQALPVLALSEVAKRGFTINQENYERQLKHTKDHLDRGKENYLKGKGQGGQVITAGYALWALDAGKQSPDATTASVTHYLLERQKSDARWHQGSKRPPTSGSDFTATYVALRALANFGTDEQQPAIEARRKQVSQWLTDTKPKDTEDRVFRLWSIPYLDIEESALQQAIEDLIDTQRHDGGWAQENEMQSDAYATSTALVSLIQAGNLPTNHDTIRRGIQYLIKTQEEDGSWHVVTRAKGFQTYFETGFPHGKDQFISHAASSWATIALALTLPESTTRSEDAPAAK